MPNKTPQEPATDPRQIDLVDNPPERRTGSTVSALPLSAAQRDALTLLRAPFEQHQISMKPQPTKQQTDEVRADYTKGIRCDLCGGWHHPKVAHLAYVGHAALTHRLLDADPFWTWEPMALNEQGLPAVDADGGMWIRLTVCGMTRLGYGDAQEKTGPNAVKERIGDALRNAGMRFGMALDLWHKGVLEMEPERFDVGIGDKWIAKVKEAATEAALAKVWEDGAAEIHTSNDLMAYEEFKKAVGVRKKELAPAGSAK